MAAETIFVDTNVLVYAKLAQAPLHVLALERLKSLASDKETFLWVSRQVLKEYLAAMTRPGTLTAPIDSDSGHTPRRTLKGVQRKVSHLRTPLKNFSHPLIPNSANSRLSLNN